MQGSGAQHEDMVSGPPQDSTAPREPLRAACHMAQLALYAQAAALLFAVMQAA